MIDINAQIAEAGAAIETQRAELEPLATDLVAAASKWASDQWERITEKVVAASPELVKTNVERLRTLKEQLRSLESDAVNITTECLAPWLLHRTTPDASLLTFARNENWNECPVYVSLPRESNGHRDEPLRRLAGAIGPALNEAGLLTDKCEVEAKGRYRYALPDHSAVTVPLDTYEAALKELIRRLYACAELEQQRDSDEATQLWRDA
jgi:hypothetical protein